jgi:endonuclease YncB( thermonuclease family)
MPFRRDPLRLLASVVFLGLVVTVSVRPAGAEPCPPLASEERVIAEIRSTVEFALDDGSVARLMGLLTPSSRDLPSPPPAWPLKAQAAAEAERLLAGRTILIADAGSFRDRYGRRVIHAFSNGELRQWLQSAMIDAGQARVAPVPGETLCLRELLLREAVARAKRTGLWANPVYNVRSARDTRALAALIGTFQLVEGWVSSVSRRRNTVYLNFGRDWRWDFTAAVDLRRLPGKDALTARLEALQGRLVRVRGFVERRNGPFIAVATAEAVEELPEGAAAGR